VHSIWRQSDKTLQTIAKFLHIEDLEERHNAVSILWNLSIRSVNKAMVWEVIEVFGINVWLKLASDDDTQIKCYVIGTLCNLAYNKAERQVTIRQYADVESIVKLLLSADPNVVLTAAAILSKGVLNLSTEEHQIMAVDEDCTTLIHNHDNDPSDLLGKLLLNRPSLFSEVSNISIIPLVILLSENDVAVCGLIVEELCRLSAHYENCAIMKDVGVLNSLQTLLKLDTTNCILLINALKLLNNLGLDNDTKGKALFIPLLVNLLQHEVIRIRSAAMEVLCRFGYFQRNVFQL
jgi:hypothetical protein